MLRVALLSAGAALLAALLWQLGPWHVLDAMSRIGWYFLSVLLLDGFHQAARAGALRACVLQPGLLRYRDALAIRLSGEAVQSLTLMGPILSEPAKAWLLERQGLSLTEAFAATITEYLISSFVTAGMSIAGLLYLVVRFVPAPPIPILAIVIACLFSAFLIASAGAIALRFYLIGTIVSGLARIGLLRGRLRPDMSWINRMEDLLLMVLRDSPARLATIALIEIVAQALLVLELWLLMRALETASSIFFAFVVEASTKVVGIAFLFVPMQLGVSEAAYALIFDAMGLSAASGFAVAFLRRALALVLAGVGLATLAVLTPASQRARSQA
jgi:uncharacterized membrane protein YbhN (UPF0104 family)